ncbi:MAG TPA: glycoside hydrolase family 3 N-terminal domain-containing protein [Abditibacterium sp.]
MTTRRTFIQTTATAIAAGLTFPELVFGAQNVARNGQSVLTRYDAQVRALLAQMTLEEKVGQMVQADQGGLRDINDIETYHLGSILSGGASDPKSGNTVKDWADLYDRLQSRALQTRLQIPILYGIDAVHGNSNVLGSVIFPHNIGLGCTRNSALVQQAAYVTAREVRATGIQWAFAPCVAVARDERWGRTYEGFGESPELARTLGEAAVRGLQGSDLRSPLSVLACAKHFIGDGGTTYGTGQVKNGLRILDQGDTRLSEAELRRLHLQGYVSAIAAGVATIMPSYNSWNGQKASGSKRLLTEILKQEMGFEGFLISDWDAIDQLPGDYKSQIEQSANAGMDMFMVPNRYRELYTFLLELARENRVSMARIDDAVTRILRVKFASGLLDKTRSQLTDRSLMAWVGSAQHRSVARECVRQSLVLLKNEGQILPLSKAKPVHLGGKVADDLGNQCGGWTISWQGRSGQAVPGGTSILQAVRAAVSQGTKVSFTLDGSGGQIGDIGIAVIGERPYAEGDGDRQDLHLAPEDVATVTNMKKAGLRVVAVIISGRPLILDNILDQCDAIVAAWLPGTEGQGVADVLFGDYKPTGKLSCSWPRTMEQIPINVGDSNYNPLFPYGFGLTYRK